MNYKETIEREMVQAAKAQDKERLSALRLIKNTLHNREIDLHRELEDTEFLQAMAAMAKQRNDSIEQFKNAGRQDLVEKETRELKVIQEFLPSQLSEEEVGREIEAAIAEAGATGLRDMGKVMKILMSKLTGKADGKLVGERLKARLSI